MTDGPVPHKYATQLRHTSWVASCTWKAHDVSHNCNALCRTGGWTHQAVPRDILGAHLPSRQDTEHRPAPFHHHVQAYPPHGDLTQALVCCTRLAALTATLSAVSKVYYVGAWQNCGAPKKQDRWYYCTCYMIPGSWQSWVIAVAACVRGIIQMGGRGPVNDMNECSCLGNGKYDMLYCSSAAKPGSQARSGHHSSHTLHLVWGNPTTHRRGGSVQGSQLDGGRALCAVS